MSRYFFNFRLGNQTLIDDQGRELLDLEAAHEEALATARDLMKPAGARNQNRWIGCSIQVLDEQGEPVLQIPLAKSGVDSVAARRFQAPGSREIEDDDVGPRMAPESDLSLGARATTDGLGHQLLLVRRRTAELIERCRDLQGALVAEVLVARDRIKRARELVSRARQGGTPMGGIGHREIPPRPARGGRPVLVLLPGGR